MKNAYGEWDESRTSLLKDALKMYLKESGVGWMLSHRDLVDIWVRCVGEEIGEQTRPSGWRNGTLTIDVFSPTLRSELEGFFSESLLSAIQTEAPELGIRKIKFRITSSEAYEPNDHLKETT